MEEFILKDKIKEGDKFIFLDFDGVITTPFTDWKLSNHHIGIIRHILETTRSKTIISSSWRRTNIKNTIEFLSTIGYYVPFKFPLIGSVVAQTSGYDIYEVHSSRGSYLQKVIDYLDIPKENYIIIDDNNDLLITQQDRFVQTNFLTGITIQDAVKCVQLLTGNYIYNIDMISSSCIA